MRLRQRLVHSGTRCLVALRRVSTSAAFPSVQPALLSGFEKASAEVAQLSEVKDAQTDAAQGLMLSDSDFVCFLFIFTCLCGG